jgi:hypothetical protein
MASVPALAASSASRATVTMPASTTSATEEHHAEFESLRPARGGDAPGLRLEVEARREGDDPETPLELAGEHLQGGHRD